MRIVISGTSGSGKSAVAKALAKELGYRHYSMGDFMREIAEEKGLNLLELGKIAEDNIEVDRQIDERQKKLNKEDNFVIDSRLGAFFIPESIKIFFDADLKTRAKRIMEDVRETEKNISLKETIKNMKKREESEKKRYKKYYNIKCYDKTKFNLVIDTTKLSIEKTVEKIKRFLKKKVKSS